MRPHFQVMADLPADCAALHPTTGEVIILRRGEEGYWPAPHIAKEAFNAERKVTPAQSEAMIAGSMFGWDNPSADPANYDTAGKFIGAHQ